MSQPSRDLQRIIGKSRIGAIHGSIFPGATRHQDLRYKQRCDRLMVERAAKLAKQAKAS